MPTKTRTKSSVSVDRIEQYFELDRQRIELNRQLSAIKKQQEILEDEFTTYVVLAGDRTMTVKKGRYTLRLVAKPGSVSWKTEFIRVAGHDEAVRIQNEAEPRTVLEID